MERAGLPPSPSLRVAKVTRRTSERNGDAQIDRSDPQKRQSKPSGLQVSYYKALRQLTDALPLPQHVIIERALAAALSESQRQLLERREAA